MGSVRTRLWGLLAVLFLAPPLTFFLYYGYRITTHQTLAIYSVVPAQFRSPAMKDDPILITAAYNTGKPARIQGGMNARIFIHGTGMELDNCLVRFHPRYDFQKARSVNASTLEAQLPADLTPGLYNVVVRDSSGHSAMLSQALEVYWVPRIEKVGPRKTYNGEELEIAGNYFQANTAVWVGSRRIRNVDWMSSKSLRVRLQFEEELPSGIYDVRVSNDPPEMQFTFDDRLRPKTRSEDPSETEFTLAQAVEIIPRPSVMELFPKEVTYGQEVALTIRGENFPKEASLLLRPHDISLKTQFVHSGMLRAWLTPEVGMSGAYDLYLTIPNGAPVLVRSSAVFIVPRVAQPVLVEIFLDQMPEEVRSHLEALPGWRGIRIVEVTPSRSFTSRATPIPQRIVVRMVLQAALLGEMGGEPIHKLTYRGKLVKRGEPITIEIAGRDVTGQVAEDPIPVFLESSTAETMPPAPE